MNRKIIGIIGIMLLLGTLQVMLFDASSFLYAQEDWKMEFDDICSRTIDAMELPPAEIKTLIERCDRLKPRIEKLEASASKVYLRRLQMCRELFAFVLENPSNKTAK